jgi:hypothetical protein
MTASSPGVALAVLLADRGAVHPRMAAADDRLRRRGDAEAEAGRGGRHGHRDRMPPEGRKGRASVNGTAGRGRDRPLAFDAVANWS